LEEAIQGALKGQSSLSHREEQQNEMTAHYVMQNDSACDLVLNKIKGCQTRI